MLNWLLASCSCSTNWFNFYLYAYYWLVNNPFNLFIYPYFLNNYLFTLLNSFSSPFIFSLNLSTVYLLLTNSFYNIVYLYSLYFNPIYNLYTPSFYSLYFFIIYSLLLYLFFTTYSLYNNNSSLYLLNSSIYIYICLNLTIFYRFYTLCFYIILLNCYIFNEY